MIPAHDPGRTVEEHLFVSSKVPWVEIEDSLPQKTGGAPFGQRVEAHEAHEAHEAD